MRVTVIGGTRFIGPHVVRGLVEAGHSVTVFHRGTHRAALPRGVREVCHGDAGMPVVRFPGGLLRIAADVVVHMVAVGEEDARAAVRAFRGRAARLVVVSSGDVYRAYGRFTGLEPGPVEPVPLTESSALRSVLFPYRRGASPGDLEYSYEKILVEREVMSDGALPATVLRLPKVYGAGGNADFASVRAFGAHPRWRWTHGYVENVAAAIVLAVNRADAAGRVYNVGELHTPTVRERLEGLPAGGAAGASDDSPYNFEQDIVYDTGLIRRELGFEEPVAYEEGLRRTLGAGARR